MKKFDLNIDQMLENWDAHHAIREIIANALDEQILTKTDDIQIVQNDDGQWIIRDFGRGIRYEHFTMNENQEKLEHPGLIGKFGVGLKDALATFDRLGITAKIRSQYCDVSFERAEKHDFSDVVTLHACISEPSNPRLIGTEFLLEGCSEYDISEAKKLFIKFSGESVLETTPYGEVLRRNSNTAFIYINGIRVAEEENFLFSYNITSLTASIKKALNRERTNVGRSAYSDRIKSILLASTSEAVANALVEDLSQFGSGRLHDEMKWTDVSVHASKITSAARNVLFLTDEEAMDSPKFIEEARATGRQIITVPNTVREKLTGQTDSSGQAIKDLDNFIENWNQDFQFKFIEPESLTENEQFIFSKTAQILDLVGGLPRAVNKIKVSETMRPERGSYSIANGLWDGTDIIIHREVLQSLEKYAGILLHEVAHVRSGEDDATIAFECELTELLGKVARQALRDNSSQDCTSAETNKAVASLHEVSELTDRSNKEYTDRSSNLDDSSKKKRGFFGRLFS